MANNKILFDSETRTFSAEGECLTEATVTFAEKEEATNVWREVWGHLQTWMFGGGPIQNIVSAVDARELVDRCNREHWSPSKCVAEVKKAAHKQKKTTRIISTITGTVAAIGGSAHAGIAAAAAGATGGAVVGVAAAALVVVLILCCLYGWTIGAWISKRGFIRIIESKLHKELMDERLSFNIHTRTFSPSMTPLEAMQKVQRDMDGEFLYGAVVGDNFYSPEPYPGAKPWEECPWDKYKVRRLPDVIADKRGTCLEYTKYAHYMLDKMGVRNRTFMILGNDGHLSHTFVVAYVGGNAYWLESAQWKNRGMHRIGTLADVGDRMAKHYTIYEFDQDKVADKEMGGNEYVKWIMRQKAVVHK